MKKLYFLFAIATMSSLMAFAQNSGNLAQQAANSLVPESGRGPIIYVNDSAGGNNTGTSWFDAYTSFQSALDSAALGDQIWVATGTYKPDSAYNLTNSSRYYHFRMIEGVAIYGGFAGAEDSISQRTDFGLGGAHETILSGDIETLGDNTDNCYHVFYHPSSLNLTGAAMLDGFTITLGYADGSSPHNQAGGMFNSSSSPTITNTTFLSNYGTNSGGMYNVSSSPTITNTTFLSNYGTNSGGMYNVSSSPTIINAEFLSNSTAVVGGGMRNSNSSPTITNATFSLNSANNGGCMFNEGNSSPTLTNTTFTLNSADRGGCMYNYSNSSPTLNNCIVWGNTATTEGKQFYLNGGGTTTLNYCCYANEMNDVTVANGGTFTDTNNNITTNPNFVDPAGDFRIYAFSPCVNAGNNDYNTQAYDIRGEARIQDSTIDMGSYEWTSGLDPVAFTVYVWADATGNNDGTNWADAFTSFQAALNVASFGNHIWVAKGTYTPSDAYDLSKSSRYSHFRMIEGVEIYGGFAGTETAVSKRTYFGHGEINETFLSGDLDGNDVVSGSGATLSITNNNENCYHVFYHPDNYVLTNTALLDGFTIKGGNANVSGPHDRAGGMYSYDKAPIITNVTFLNNAAKYGGGMWIYKDAPTLTNVTFQSNYATVNCGGLFNQSTSNQTITDALFQSNYSVVDGGGMANNNSSPTITNIVFQMNSAGNDGGGMYNYYSSSPTIINATFRMNSSPGRGGGMYNINSSPTIINAEFSSNSAGYGGGMFNYENSNPVVTNASFSRNNGTTRGGGVYCFVTSSPTFNNCIVWGNTTTTGTNGQQFGLDGETTTLNYCCYANRVVENDVFTSHSGTLAASNNNITTNPKFIDPAGDFRIHGNSPCVNTGFNNYFTLADSVDIRGEARIQDSTIDMGAYEWTTGMDPLTDIVYVNDTATGINNGTNWANAFTSFQSALDLAASGDQVWVAAGTYKPSYAYDFENTSRYYHFRMIEGVEIYGGFAGTETAVSQRTDFGHGETNETFLSGDIGIVDDRTDNCYYIFYHPEDLILTGAALLDGFTITLGYADGGDPSYSKRGAGMCNRSNSSPSITNTVFLDNYAELNGGALHNDRSNPTITNVQFIANSAGGFGGGMYNWYSSPTMTNVTFRENSSASNGGGMSNREYSSPTITNVTFESNNSSYKGGGLSNVTQSSPTLTNVTFHMNHADIDGGGVYNEEHSSPIITNAEFSSNSTAHGGGMYNHEDSNPVITNTTFSKNTASVNGGGIYSRGSSSPTFNNCIVYGNTATNSGNQFYINSTEPTSLNYTCYANGTNDVFGTPVTDYCITTNPKFIDPAYDFRLHGNSPCVNTGFNDYFTLVDSVDIRGEARIQNITIDMGAYEYTSGLDPADQIFYVNDTATGSNNGESWANALTSFQSALNLAASGDQIWVAADTCKPSYAYDLTDSSRYYHFRMIEGVAIYGGFAGTEDSISQRTDFGMDGTNETSLSGDIGTVGDNTDNCYHVFYHPEGLNLTGAAILDGFTITGGNADGTDLHGGGAAGCSIIILLRPSPMLHSR